MKTLIDSISLAVKKTADAITSVTGAIIAWASIFLIFVPIKWIKNLSRKAIDFLSKFNSD